MCAQTISASFGCRTALLLAAIVLLAAGPLGPSPASADTTVLAGVSCAGSNVCVAVGTKTVTRSAKNRLVALRRTGSHWSALAPRQPASQLGSVFRGVSCTSPTFCLAVGGEGKFQSNLPLAEFWDGSRWRYSSTIARPTDQTTLEAVGCASASFCAVVGQAADSDSNNAMAEVWSGGRWIATDLPLPDGATWSELNKVSCVSATFCVAVGSVQPDNSSDSQPLIETWDGQAWTMAPVPTVRLGVNGVELNGVSCLPDQTCVAVGSGARPLVMKLTDAWRIAAEPNLKSATFDGVACAALASCLVVGTKGSKYLARRISGDSVLPAAGPRSVPKRPVPVATDFSCRASTDCVMVGWAGGLGRGALSSPVAESWNGKSWSRNRLPGLK